MPTATLTSKGQITMPQSVRQSLGLQTGDKIDFVPDEEGGFKVIALRKDVSILRGRFAGRVARPVSLRAMEKAVGDEAAARARPARPGSPRPARRPK
ncbi:MAG: AbrB/MazE/SpoVT family DNA-binding domain-containing protein [Burkholderiales bacterium]